MEGKATKVPRVTPTISIGSTSSDPTRICVFTGAGIGAPLKLPTTDQFRTTINNIRPELLDFITGFLGNKANDIEKVLYLLEDFIRANDFTSHIVKSGGDESFKTVNANLNQYKAWAQSSIGVIKSDIYDLLEEYKSEDSFILYSSIIKEIRSCYQHTAISIFTTNYDLTFENGFADQTDELHKMGIEDVYYGFSGRNQSKYDLKQVYNWESHIIEYKKLHGSLDWGINRDKQCIKTGVNVRPRNPNDMPLLYPGFKGIPSKQPFIDLHDQFSDRLSGADVLIVIGFAFRDQYLNNLFESSIKRNSKLLVLCYNPADISELPDDSSLGEFVKDYPNRFKHIKHYVELRDNPLSLFNEVAFET